MQRDQWHEMGYWKAESHLKYLVKSEIISKISLTHLRTMFPSNRNQSVTLQWKSTDWFLYDNNIFPNVTKKD